MAATQAYWNWVRDGRPWRVAAPIRQLGDLLKRYGYTVYYLGSDDASHLQASRPQDHCPFSVTGWPVAHPYPVVTALDIMPPPKGSGLPSLQQLGAQIVADRNAGVAGTEWLKYMNWEPDRDWGGRCWQDSWKPSHSRTNSSDRGHIHASGRSDRVTDPGPLYDPVARVRGQAPAPAASGGDEMKTLTIARSAHGQWYVCDGMTSRPIPASAVGDIAYLGNEGRWKVVMGPNGGPRDGWYEDAFGQVEETRAERVASYQREADTLAATKAIHDAITAVGGDPGQLDLAPVLAKIDARADEVRALLAEKDAELAALRARLAEALAPGAA